MSGTYTLDSNGKRFCIDSTHIKGIKRYGHSDSMTLGKYFTAHLSSMTGEDLHSKAGIAGELGYRDMVIEHLACELEHIYNMLLDGRSNELRSEHIVATLDKFPLETFKP